MFALANGLIVGRFVKFSVAIIGVRTREISEASSTSLATVTSMEMKPSSSSTNLLLSLSRKTIANNNEVMKKVLFYHKLCIHFAYQCFPV